MDHVGAEGAISSCWGSGLSTELRMGPAGDRRWWERQGGEGGQEVKIQGIEEVG